MECRIIIGGFRRVQGNAPAEGWSKWEVARWGFVEVTKKEKASRIGEKAHRQAVERSGGVPCE